MNMKSIMTPCPYKVRSETSLKDAISMMEANNIRHLPVVDDESVIGVIPLETARLMLLTCELTNHCPTVGSSCTKDPYVTTEDTHVSVVAKEMADKKIDCALVADHADNFVGIFTTTDACRFIYLKFGED